ncbi:N6-adenosine-methyltransferase subunit mettl14 [Dimargaris cristalligena]|nr:N6-adenosine-methyltransferase subunit mettl14 [Dimargaris cristalligena]
MDNICNDYAQHFVTTRSRPQNYVADADYNERFIEYPKLRELLQRKDAQIRQRATPPLTLRTDLKTFPLTSLGQRFFDVIVVDPPWKEYADRKARADPGSPPPEPEPEPRLTAPVPPPLPSESVPEADARGDCPTPPTDTNTPATPPEKGDPYWTFEEIAALNIPEIAASPSSNAVLEPTKEHCLMGIRGTARRSADSHFIHCNIDTDVIIADEPPLGSSAKPNELLNIIEHFCLGRRRLYLFGEDNNVRPGWVTAGLGLSSSNFDYKTYHDFFKEPSGHLLGFDKAGPGMAGPFGALTGYRSPPIQATIPNRLAWFHPRCDPWATPTIQHRIKLRHTTLIMPITNPPTLATATATATTISSSITTKRRTNTRPTYHPCIPPPQRLPWPIPSAGVAIRTTTLRTRRVGPRIITTTRPTTSPTIPSNDLSLIDHTRRTAHHTTCRRSRPHQQGPCAMLEWAGASSQDHLIRLRHPSQLRGGTTADS